MRFVEAGGVRLSAVGLGTWQFGSSEWGYGATYAESTAPAIVERSLDLGVNLLDTAEIYGFGRSERILGRALAGRRSAAFLASKLLPVLPADPVVGWRARGSLRRLSTDHLDLYQLHWPNPVVPLERTAAALARLRREGVVRHLGVSNFPLEKWQALEQALEALEQPPGGTVLSNQVRYSLIDRRPERDLLPWAQANGRLIIAYSPLSQGLLAGRYDAEHLPTGLRAKTSSFLPDNVRALSPLLELLGEVADAHGASRAQVALAWLIRRPNVVVIPGASSVAQAESNAAAADLDLGEEEDAALTAASDAYAPISGKEAVPSFLRAGVARYVRRVRRVSEGLRR